MKTKKIFIFIIIALVIFVGFYFLNGKMSRDKSLVQVVVAPKWLNQAQFAGMFFAQEEGLYRDKGLDVTFKEFGFEATQIEDLMNGVTEFALISAEEFLVFIDEGKPLQALAAIYQQSPYAIVSLKKSEIHSPADLQGKSLGNKSGKLEEELFYLLLLNTVGLTSDDVTMINLGFERREIDDLKSGEVETVGLYRTDQLYFFNEEDTPYNILIPERFGVNIYNDILIARTDYINKNPEIVRGFVQATIDGWNRALEDREKAIDITMKYVTDDNYKNVEYERFILDNSVPLIKPNKNQVIGWMTFSKWNNLHRNMYERGLVGEDIDIASIFTTEFIK